MIDTRLIAPPPVERIWKWGNVRILTLQNESVSGSGPCGFRGQRPGSTGREFAEVQELGRVPRSVLKEEGMIAIGKRRRGARAGVARARRDEVTHWASWVKLISLKLVMGERKSQTDFTVLVGGDGVKKTSKWDLRRGRCGQVNRLGGRGERCRWWLGGEGWEDRGWY